jgi:hypothetical protein
VAHQPCNQAHQFVRDCDPIQLAVAPLHLVVRGAAIRLLCTRLPAVCTVFYAPEVTSLPTGMGDECRSSRLCYETFPAQTRVGWIPLKQLAFIKTIQSGVVQDG